jgi:hypothetical protein
MSQVFATSSNSYLVSILGVIVFSSGLSQQKAGKKSGRGRGRGTGTRFLISKLLIKKFLITLFLITVFLSNKVPKLQNS